MRNCARHARDSPTARESGGSGQTWPPARAGNSLLVDVYVDRIGNLDGGSAVGQPKLGAEHPEKHQHDDDEEDDREDSSAASASAGFDYGRSLGISIIGIRLQF